MIFFWLEPILGTRTGSSIALAPPVAQVSSCCCCCSPLSWAANRDSERPTREPVASEREVDCDSLLPHHSLHPHHHRTASRASSTSPPSSFSCLSCWRAKTNMNVQHSPERGLFHFTILQPTLSWHASSHCAGEEIENWFQVQLSMDTTFVALWKEIFWRLFQSFEVVKPRYVIFCSFFLVLSNWPAIWKILKKGALWCATRVFRHPRPVTPS